ncbi:MAG: phosphate ABC transporter substrate-binding/OmpA family protein [Planctomycetota bacterium]
MSSKRSRILVVVVVWLLIIGSGAAAYRYFFAPRIEEDLISRTRAPNAEGLEEISLALDSFSGYCLFRSSDFSDELAAAGIAVNLVDDGADYARRLRSVSKGTTPLALFTIDAFLKASADAGESPGTIILVVDESQGADALVARKSDVADLDALNRADARVVTTPDSPSETLFRVVRSYFNMDELPEDCWIAADGAEDVLRQLSSKRAGGAPRAYALWEPYVSRALALPEVIKLVDSSKFDGYIIDVLVAQREFLVQNEVLVESFVKAYLRTLYRARNDLETSVFEDARALAEPVTRDQARQLVAGVHWCNTHENYLHFALGGVDSKSGVRPLPVLLENIKRVLTRTGAISEGASEKLPARDLYFPGVLSALQGQQFHPGAGGAASDGTARQAPMVRPLTDAQWGDLLRVGTLRVDRLVFRPGTARLRNIDEIALAELVDTLRNWPQYYLRIEGHASARGDAQQNRILAGQRADVVRQFLIDSGVQAQRLHATSEEPQAVGGEYRSVTFVFGELAY